MNPTNFHEHNRLAWNRLAKSGNRFARPASEADYENPLASVDGPGWLGKSITGKRVLCLAAGGGRQGPIYAAAGAIVTVVDVSHEMLLLDQQVSKQKNFNIRTVETSMDDLSSFDSGVFDIVIHPVSTCYISNVQKVFDEVARVMVAGGVYISQHKNPTSLQSSISPSDKGYVVEYPFHRAEPLPEPRQENLVREPGMREYIHSTASLLGGICKAGFVISALSEPVHADRNAEVGRFEHRSNYLPPYIRIKAVRDHSAPKKRNQIWSPE
ncbi:MAG: class I SAM-dependent methyltransferase [Planctomycetota bacterium]